MTLRPVPSGGGPHEPDLVTRVALIEEKVDRIERGVNDLEPRLRTIEATLAEIKGRVSQSPSRLQLLVAIVATWGAGAAIVAGVVRFLQ
jgi:hypothetical protein